MSSVFRAICNNYWVNSQYGKEQFQAEVSEEGNKGEGIIKKQGAPYEDPKIYFLKVLLKNLPTGSNKSEK